MLIAASLVYGYGIGHVTTLGPVVVRREFGAAAFGATYGAAATVIQLTSAFGPALFGFLRDSFGGYGPGLMIASLVTALGGFSLFGRIAGLPARLTILRQSPPSPDRRRCARSRAGSL